MNYAAGLTCRTEYIGTRILLRKWKKMSHLSVARPKVVNLDVVTSLNIPANRVLEAAIDKLEGVVIMGRQPDGEYYFASSIADGGTVLWMWEKLKHKLMKVE